MPTRSIFSGNMRQTLAVITLVAILPLVLLQVGIYATWYKAGVEREKQGNLEVARSLALSVDALITDVRHQQETLLVALEQVQPFSTERASEILRRGKMEYSTIRTFALTDSEGKVVASSEPRLYGLWVGDRQYFRELKDGAEWSYSNLLVARDTSMPVFTIAHAIRDGGGRFRGIIFAGADPARMGDVTLAVRRQGGATFNVFDGEGTLVYYSGASIGHPNWKDRDPLLKSALEGQEAAGIITSPAHGDRRIAARVPVKSTDWVVGASRSLREAMLPVYTGLWWIVGLNMLVLTGSLVASWYKSRQIVQQVTALRHHADAIGEGDLSHCDSVGGINELEMLSDSFNSMASQLRDRQDQLENTVMDLKRSNEELEQFAYVASHDLQEPLRVVTGYVQLLARRYKGKLDADADKFIRFIVEAVTRQQQLINDLLAFSRVGTRGKPFAPVELNAVVDEAVANLQEVIASEGAMVRRDQLPVVEGDYRQLVQVVQNLIANGIKFHGPKRPEIRVSAEKKGQEWVIAVADNGIGIEPQYAERIFVIFQRLHTRQEYPGTGIGLAVCSKIVNRHGGRIWVESTPGQGSVFYFTLRQAGES